MQHPEAVNYRAATVAWHLDKPGGNHKVFQLLQETYRIIELLTSTSHHR
jgi:hypothetical protein